MNDVAEVYLVGSFLLLVVIGCISAVFDIRTQKIPNCITSLIFAVGVIFQITHGVRTGSEGFLFQYAGIYFLLIIVVFFLFHFQIWAAGDGKLFLVMLCILPVTNTITLLRISVIAFALTFSLSFCFLIADSIWQWLGHRDEWELGKDFLKNLPKQFRYSFVIWTCLNAVSIGLRWILPKFPSWGISLVAIVLVFVFRTKWRERIEVAAWLDKLIGGLLLLLIVIATEWIGVFLRNWLIVVGIMALKNFAGNYNYRSLDIAELKVGMVLSLPQTLEFQRSRVKGLPGASFEDFRSRLSVDEVESIQRWKGSKYGRNQVEVVRFIPFAPFLSLGMVIAFLMELT